MPTPEEVRAEIVRRERMRRREADFTGPGHGHPAGLDPLNPTARVSTRLPNMPKNIKGIGENLVALGTGAVAEPIAGAAGLASLAVHTAMSVFQGKWLPGAVDNAANTIDRVREFIAVEPKTEAGQEIAGAIARPFAAIERFADRAGEVIGRGNPLASAFVKTVLLGWPTGLGYRGLKAKRQTRDEQIRVIEEGARELGVELGPDIRQQLREAGEQSAVATRGESMGPVQIELKAKYEAARAEKNRLYEDARATQASIDQANIRSLNARLGYALDGFDITPEFHPVIVRRLQELDNLSLDQGRAMTINEIEGIRKKASTSRPPRANEQQNTAISRFNQAIDEFLEDMRNRDMVRGDPEAIASWERAIEANKRYRATFTTNKVLRQLLELGPDNGPITVEQMRAWTFGSSQSGFGPQAAQTIQALGKAIGTESQAFSALRTEAMFNFVQPLLEPNPNFARFARQYDNILRNNPTLIDVLSLESKTPLQQLRKLADAVETTGAAPPIDINLNRALAQVLFGHNIAQAGLRVNLATTMIQLLRGTGASERHAMLTELMGYDPFNMPIMPRGGPAAAAIILAEIEESKNDFSIN